MVKKPDKGSERLRKYRWLYSGRYYFRTTSTFEREKIFVDKETFVILCDSLRWMEENKRWTWFALMAMPDNIHLVFALGSDITLAGVMDSFKGYTGMAIKRALQLNHPVWQRHYYDRLIRREDEYRETVKYCYYNPLRKGLVKRARDYPFWECKWAME